MSYVEQLHKLEAVERDLEQACLDRDRMLGEPFDRELETLLDQLYGTHEMLCRAAALPSWSSTSTNYVLQAPNFTGPKETHGTWSGSQSHPSAHKNVRQVMGTDRREAL